MTLLERCLTIDFFGVNNRGLPDALEKPFLEWARENWKLNDNFAFSKKIPRGKRLFEYNLVGRCFRPQEGLTWIMAFGIPAHLKSLDVCRKIGEFCGGFVDVNRNGWDGPFICIQVKSGAQIPEQVPLIFGTTLFPVKIVVPPAAQSPLADQSRRHLLLQFSCQAKSFPVEVEPPPFPPLTNLEDPGELQGGCGSGRSSPCMQRVDRPKLVKKVRMRKFGSLPNPKPKSDSLPSPLETSEPVSSTFSPCLPASSLSPLYTPNLT
ncbi:unnamed protein product [Linum trigynum]|uniref:Uncharacterized protein n=1 Tax=Linum trigynum TaxID=586398 RepID=A0AAV2D8C0_9ROSI